MLLFPSIPPENIGKPKIVAVIGHWENIFLANEVIVSYSVKI